MNNSFFYLILMNFMFAISLIASNIHVQGEITNNVWTSDTVFVTDDLIIPENTTLEIQSGVRVIISGGYGIRVNGNIIANGTSDEMIIFTSTIGDFWNGFFLQSLSQDSSQFNYCEINGVQNENFYVSGIDISTYNYVNISNCLFTNNTSRWRGGALYIDKAQVEVVNSRFKSNDALEGGAIYSTGGATLYISGNIFEQNHANWGGSIVISGNSEIIINKNIINNNSSESAAGGVSIRNSKCYFVNNIVTQNSAIGNNGSEGGGLHISDAALIQNNLILQNTSILGGGVHFGDTKAKFINNTISQNTAEKGGGIFFYSRSQSNLISNSIIYGNSAQEGNQIYFHYTPLAYLNYNNIAGGSTEFGYKNLGDSILERNYINNLDVEPNFISPVLDEVDDFEQARNWGLNSNSLCINGGIVQNFDTTFAKTDLVNNNRIFDGKIDMGAIEFQGIPDSIVRINIEESTLNYGFVNLDSDSEIKSINITNYGHSNLIIENLHTPDGFLFATQEGTTTTNINSFIVPPKSEITINIIFHPTTRKDYSDSLRITNNSDFNKELFVKLKGEGRKITYLSGIIEGHRIIEDLVFINEDVTISNNAVLTILPGSELKFKNGTKLCVEGQLLAEGTEQDSINFTVANHTDFYSGGGYNEVGWKGITFDNTGGLLNSSDTSKILYCKIEYCKSGYNSNDVYGGSIKIINFSKLVVSNSFIRNNLSIDSHILGGGIYLSDSSPQIISNTISNNKTVSSGGGIHCEGSQSKPKIISNEVSHNESRDGAAVFIGIYSSPILKDNKFIHNKAVNRGGAVYCTGGGNTVIESNVIGYNTATNGGGIYILRYRGPIDGNYIVNNNALNTGGGIEIRDAYYENEELVLSNNLIANNSARDIGGGIKSSSTIQLLNNTIVNNSAEYFAAISGRVNLYNCIVFGNQSYNGTSMFFYEFLTYLNNIFLVDSNQNAEIWDYSSFRENIVNISPKFLSPSMGAGAEFDALAADWSLRDSSLALNSGDNAHDSIYVSSNDLLGNPRIINDKIDIGAIESNILPARFYYITGNKERIEFPLTQISTKSDSIKIRLFNFGQDSTFTSTLYLPEGFKARSQTNIDYSSKIEPIFFSPKSQVEFDLIFVPTNPKMYSEQISFVDSVSNKTLFSVELKGAASKNIVVEGILDSSMVWKDSVLVTGDVEITDNTTIVIEPNTKVLFMGQYSIIAYGSISSIGTEQDSIHFTIYDKQKYMKGDFSTGWAGMDFPERIHGKNLSVFAYTSFSYINSSSGGSISIKSFNNGFENCRFTDNFSGGTGGALEIIRPESKVSIKNCTFQRNEAWYGGAIHSEYADSTLIENCFFINNFAKGRGGAINLNSSIGISKCVFYNNEADIGGAVFIYCTSDEALISDNKFSNNYASKYGGGINLFGKGATIINNLFVNNTASREAGALHYQPDYEVNILFINNTFANNNSLYGQSGGIKISKLGKDGSIHFYNDIYSGNRSQEGLSSILLEVDSEYLFSNCNIENFSIPELDTNKYINTISLNPMFIMPTDSVGMEFNGLAADWRLKNNSPCINRGVDSIPGIIFPKYDIEGNERIVARVDLGAYENQIVVAIKDDYLLPTKYDLSQNFPNPFNPTTSIRYSIPRKGFVKIKIFDNLGREVAELVNKQQLQGNYEVQFNAQNLSSGIYFYQLTSGDFSETKKLLLLK